MNATLLERTETLGGPLAALLREYSAKLTDLNRELIQEIERGKHAVDNPSRLAWLLDRSKRLDLPMRELVNHVANSIDMMIFSDEYNLESTELAIRLGETEAQLHHMLRHAYDLQKLIDNFKAGDAVARLRESAGLNGMKGGPLRPKA